MVTPMSRRSFPFVLLVALTVPFVAASAQKNPGLVTNGAGADEIHAVEQARIDALAAADIAALDKIVHEKGVHVTSSGQVRDKTAFIKNASNRDYNFPKWEFLEQTIHVNGDMAVAMGAYRNARQVQGQPVTSRSARHLRVYVRENSRWQLLAHQATDLPAN